MPRKQIYSRWSGDYVSTARYLKDWREVNKLFEKYFYGYRVSAFDPGIALTCCDLPPISIDGYLFIRLHELFTNLEKDSKRA